MNKMEEQIDLFSSEWISIKDSTKYQLKDYFLIYHSTEILIRLSPMVLFLIILQPGLDQGIQLIQRYLLDLLLFASLLFRQIVSVAWEFILF